MAEIEFDWDASVKRVQTVYISTWKSISDELIEELARAKSELSHGPGNPGKRRSWKQYVFDCFGDAITLKTVDRWLERRQLEHQAWMAVFGDARKPKSKSFFAGLYETMYRKPAIACDDVLLSQKDEEIKVTFSVPEYPNELFEKVLFDKSHNEKGLDSVRRVPSYEESPWKEDPQIADIKSRLGVPTKDFGGLFTYCTEFSGYGGAALGLREALGQGIYAIEWLPEVCDVFKENFKNYPEGCTFNADITKISGQFLLEKTGLVPGQLDLFQSSAPCQGFSIANSIRDPNDDRNKLFFSSVEHVEKLLPKLVIFENVEGMTEGEMRPAFMEVVRALADAGYWTKSWVLRASDYGCPQTRPRTWIIGFRKDLEIEPSIPKHLPWTIPLNQEDLGVPWLLGHQQGQYSKRFYPADFPISTVTKTRGLRVLDDKMEAREPTIEELAKLSTFPDDYVFSGVYSRDFAGMGNSVLPRMMLILAEYLVPILKGEKPSTRWTPEEWFVLNAHTKDEDFPNPLKNWDSPDDLEE